MRVLVIVAYKQPIARGDIEHIRGYSSDSALDALLQAARRVATGEKPGRAANDGHGRRPEQDGNQPGLRLATRSTPAWR